MGINFLALEEIDRSPFVASEASVEEVVRIWKIRPMGKGNLHLVFVGIGDRDHSVAGPHGTSPPLPFLDDFRIRLKDALTNGRKRCTTPVDKSHD